MNKQTDKNGVKNIILKNFIQVSVSLCLKAKGVLLAHREAVWLGKGEIQDVSPTEFVHVL